MTSKVDFIIKSETISQIVHLFTSRKLCPYWTTSSKNRARYFYCCTIIKERELEREVIFAFAFLVGLSSRPDVFCKKVLLEISQKSQGNTLPEFLNKVAGLRPATLLKKRPWHRCFPVNFVKFLRTPFFTEHLLWLFLY